MLDGGELLDPRADRRVRSVAFRNAVGQVGRSAHGFARDDDQAVSQGVDVDRDRVEALVDGERNGLAMVLERPPVAPDPGLEANASEDERPMVGILELLGGVDPTVDPDIRAVGRRPRARSPRPR